MAIRNLSVTKESTAAQTRLAMTGGGVGLLRPYGARNDKKKEGLAMTDFLLLMQPVFSDFSFEGGQRYA